MQISTVYAIVFGPNFREGQKFSGGQTVPGGRPLPPSPVEESQLFNFSTQDLDFKFTLQKVIEEAM